MDQVVSFGRSPTHNPTRSGPPRGPGWTVNGAGRPGTRDERGREVEDLRSPTDEGPFKMLRLTLAWVVVNGLLMAPWWVSNAAGNSPDPGWVALEAALLVGLMALLPRRRWSQI